MIFFSRNTFACKNRPYTRKSAIVLTTSSVIELDEEVTEEDENSSYIT